MKRSTDTKKQGNGRPYNSVRWRRMRRGKLANEPGYVYCGGQANVVDHIKPHRGDESLFWDSGNHQSVCRFCHDSICDRKDRGVIVEQTGIDGTRNGWK